MEEQLGKYCGTKENSKKKKTWNIRLAEEKLLLQSLRKLITLDMQHKS